MFRRISTSFLLAAGIAVLGTVFPGCTSPNSSPAPTASRPPAPTPTAQTPSQPTAAANNPAPQAAEPDEATLLAHKTSEYARDITPLLGQSPATQPSLVQWTDPSSRPSNSGSAPSAAQPSVAQFPSANQPATLSPISQLKEDPSVPLILPESADQLPSSSPNAAAAAPVAIATDQYEQQLHKLVQDYPRDLGNQLDYQLLRLVRNEPVPDLSDVSQLSDEDRDLLMVMMDGLTNFRTASRSNENMMLNSKIQPLIEMADRLRSQASLSIPTVAFCTQVASFGVYRPMQSSRFPVGVENQMIVYNEVANFTSVQDNTGIWRTRMRQQMVLYTDTGLAVWPDKSNEATFVDQSRNRRHDFFISRRIILPSSLAAGKYVLKITLTDDQSDRVVEASAPLEIVADSGASAPEPAADRTTPDSSVLGQ